ncbi:type II toxin-antitoxin system Phd/YefM family antitoxin [Desulfosarcina ovata]|uniref:Antitoxin n=1 Tax=Desulfosarcina ovata subsp. ovata TaxID=2752305 RepID=A0A5K8A8A1_9BACT|nr:type II toxin-antitoxin system Phd/YefM family antitoxin [Desulfosarcina ovata]BBO88574.1 hypothetical protein DSCOOX_17540 [Desulfosarcina ovata subsp. ovata]
MQSSDYISATTLSKKTSATLDTLANGDKDKVIVLKNNAPKAVLLSMECYEAMQQEMEDLRLTALALARLDSFDPKKALSHDYMKGKFGA